MRARVMLAAVLATLAWVPQSVQNVSAIYCYPGDPPAVYQACVAYNSGIGQQVHNQNQLKSIQSQIKNTVAQINAIDQMIAGLKNQIASHEAMISRTQAASEERGQRSPLREEDGSLEPPQATARDRSRHAEEPGDPGCGPCLRAAAASAAGDPVRAGPGGARRDRRPGGQAGPGLRCCGPESGRRLGRVRMADPDVRLLLY